MGLFLAVLAVLYNSEMVEPIVMLDDKWNMLFYAVAYIFCVLNFITCAIYLDGSYDKSDKRKVLSKLITSNVLTSNKPNLYLNVLYFAVAFGILFDMQYYLMMVVLFLSGLVNTLWMHTASGFYDEFDKTELKILELNSRKK